MAPKDVLSQGKMPHQKLLLYPFARHHLWISGFRTETVTALPSCRATHGAIPRLPADGEIAMNPNTATAHRRLLALTTLAAVAATFACRPAWSPDSKQVAYPGRVDGKLALATYDVEEQTSKIVLVTAAEKGMAMPHFLANDDLLVLSSKPGDNKPLIVTRVPVGATDSKKLPGPFEVSTDDNSADYLVIPPVVVANQLFLGGKSLTRVDLSTGKTLRHKVPNADGDVVLSPRGDGICYVAVRDSDDKSQWELGTIDPDTLATTVLFKAPESTAENPGWKVLPLPSFTKDLKRVALPGERIERTSTEQTQTAILVFHEGKLETVLPLSDQQDQIGVGSLAWGPDNVSLFAVLARQVDEGQRFSLYETTFSGSVTRETVLIDAPATTPASSSAVLPALQMQVALSPNGKWAAVTTSYVHEWPTQDKALLLVDVSGKERTVKAVPFPKPAKKNR
tara:strand:+ start:231595 stop:232950 length:1356 start_codon:yes stop_codon:yes gene_type:complete